jgi:hypothetical protein
MRPGKADRREGNKGKGRDDSAQVAAGVQWTRVLIGVYRENVEGWRSNDIPGKLSKQENTVQYVVKLVSGRVKKGLPVLRNRGELESTVADVGVASLPDSCQTDGKRSSLSLQSSAAGLSMPTLSRSNLLLGSRLLPPHSHLQTRFRSPQLRAAARGALVEIFSLLS